MCAWVDKRIMYWTVEADTVVDLVFVAINSEGKSPYPL